MKKLSEMSDEEFNDFQSSNKTASEPSGSSIGSLFKSAVDKGLAPAAPLVKEISDSVGTLLKAAGLTRDFFSGVLEKPVQKQGIAYTAGKYAPTVGGGMLGAALTPLTPVIGGAAGAGAGRSLQNLAQSAAGTVSPGSAAVKTTGEQITEPLAAAGSQAVFGGLAGALTGPSAVRAGAQALRIGPGMKEDVGAAALSRTKEIFNSKSLKAAGKGIEEAVAGGGLKSGIEGLKKSFGKRLFPNDVDDEILETVMTQIEHLGALTKQELAALPQKALSARQMITNAIQAPKYTNPKAAMNSRELWKTVKQIDDYLSPIIPKYAQAAKNYRDAIVKEAFSSLFPQNLNKTASNLKSLGAAAAGGAGWYQYRQGDQKGVAASLLALSAFSPLMVGMGLRGAQKAVASNIPQLLSRMGLAAGANAANPLGGARQ